MDIKRITITNSFQNTLDESNDRPDKIWQIKADNFIIKRNQKRSKKLWLQDNTREMYSAFKEGKYVITERFIRTFKRIIAQLK